MKKRVLLLMIFFTFLVSSLTLFLVLHYLDPYNNVFLGTSILIITFLLSLSSFFTVVFYFFKKIYYRGEVYVYHVLTSFRQSFFLALFLLGVQILFIIGAPLFITSVLLFALLVFVELFLKNLEN